MFAGNILEGKSAIVTGGATGIGAYIVRKLGKLGARVGMVSRKAENLNTAAARFQEADGIEVAWRSADVRDSSAIQGAFTELQTNCAEWTSWFAMPRGTSSALPKNCRRMVGAVLSIST